MQALHILALSLLAVCISCTELGHTWPPWAEECEDGLPFDGSIVPDCRLYVDPANPSKDLHYLQHSTSKTWLDFQGFLELEAVSNEYV